MITRLSSYVWLPLIVFLLIGGDQPIPAADSSPGVSLQNFDATRDWSNFGRLFAPYGVRSDRTVTTEATGLRFQLGPRKDPGHVGMKADAPLSGNFQVEVKYEIEACPSRIEEGYGVGFGIWINVGDQVGGASLVHGIYHRQGERFNASFSVPRFQGVYYATTVFPTKSKHGRLAVRRVGQEVILLAADSPSGDLLELTRYPCPDVPTKTIHLFADTGGAAAEFRGRMYDLQIRTGSAVPTEAKKAPGGKVQSPYLPPQSASAPVPDQADVSVLSLPTTAQPRAVWWLPVLTFILGLGIGIMITRLMIRRSMPKASTGRK